MYVSRGYLHIIWGWEASIHPIWLGSEGHQLICQAFWCLSVHPLSQSVGCFLLDWILLDVCYASCCCTFLCIVIMSQASTTIAMTTTPLVTVVSSNMSCLSSVTMAPSLMRLPVTLGQCDVVLPPPLMPR